MPHLVVLALREEDTMIKLSPTIGTKISTYANYAAAIFGAVDWAGLVPLLPPKAAGAIAVAAAINGALHMFTGNAPIVGPPTEGVKKAG